MDNTIGCVLGKKGSGKSTLTREICSEWPRVIVLDTMGEYPYEQAWGFNKCCGLLLDVAEESRYRVSLTGLSAPEGIRLLGVLWSFRNVLVVVEEASVYCSPARLPDELQSLILRGRHHAISQLYVSQRPAVLHRSITASADYTVVFRQHEPRDLLYLRSHFGEEVEELRTLPDYQIRAFGDLNKAPLAVLDRLERQPPPRKTLERMSQVSGEEADFSPRGEIGSDNDLSTEFEGA